MVLPVQQAVPQAADAFHVDGSLIDVKMQEVIVNLGAEADPNFRKTEKNRKIALTDKCSRKVRYLAGWSKNIVVEDDFL